MTFIHELIDHGSGVSSHPHGTSMRHLFFNSEANALAYRAKFHPSRAARFQYIHRAWGPIALARTWIEDHR